MARNGSELSGKAVGAIPTPVLGRESSALPLSPSPYWKREKGSPSSKVGFGGFRSAWKSEGRGGTAVGILGRGTEVVKSVNGGVGI